MDNQQKACAQFIRLLETGKRMDRDTLQSKFMNLGFGVDDFGQTWTWMVKNRRVSYDTTSGLVWLNK